MKTLQIRWQRLLNEKGQTCDRCGDTESAAEEAVEKLRGLLAPMGVDVVLEKIAINQSEFSKDTLQSNRIWIDGKPLEDWVTGKIGQSRCCSACGDSDCRTVAVDGIVYEAIPVDLLLQAGFLAGMRLAEAETDRQFPGHQDHQGHGQHDEDVLNPIEITRRRDLKE